MTENKKESMFVNTIEPFWVDPERDWVEMPVEDRAALKPLPEKDVLAIVGDGACVLEDMERFLSFDVPADFMCINFSPKIMPGGLPIAHFIAGDSHTPDMQKMAESLEGLLTIRHCWNRNSPNFDVRWSRNSSKPWNGTSANLGLRIGIYLGYMRIVLIGCPMDNSGNWYTKKLAETDVKRYKDHTAHLWKWVEIASRPIGRFVRSMSGETMKLLGEPDKDWLENLF